MSSVITIKVPIPASSGRPQLVRDALLRGSNGGLNWLFDTTFGYSYPGSDPVTRPAPAPPVDEQPIIDVSGHSSNGTLIPGHYDAAINVSSPGQIAWTNYGFDTTPANDRDNCIRVPNAADDVALTYNGDTQLFHALLYLRLPPALYTGSLAVSLLHFGVPGSGQELFNLLMGSNAMGSYRPRLGGTDACFNTPATNQLGKFAQISIFRTASTYRMDVRTVDQQKIGNPQPAGDDNNNNLTGITARIGLGVNGWSTPLPTIQRDAAKFTIYRASLENLARSLRDPVAVADADWMRVVSRYRRQGVVVD